MTREEWQLLLALAGVQRVRGILYHRLKSRGCESMIPQELVLALNEAYRHNALRNLVLYRELNRIVTALQARRIPVIVLKGAFLASVVYGNLGLREMNDLDLLVPVPDL